MIAYCHSCDSPMNVETLPPFSNVECPTCLQHTRVKREFGPYTLVSRHAVGGMSMVFAAHDTTLDREVALKILSEEFSADEKRIAAFEEEARITASFSHPHVVRVLRTGRAFGRFYIAMELVPGGHFERQIRERGKIPEVEMLGLAIEVAQGLKAAHTAGLIHRDVKPGNILLDAEGHAKLVDFGLALVTQGGKAQAEEIWATPYYVPPETVEGHPEDFRSDIYAFGATLYHALAGFPSCGEETMSTEILREAKRRVVPLGIADPKLSVETCKIVEQAMAYAPEQRFSSYDQLISRLEDALKRLKSSATWATESSGNAARRLARKQQRERGILAAAAVVLLGGVSGGIWWINREQPVKESAKPISVVGPTLPAPTSTESTDIAKDYREARAAAEARDFKTAAAGFVKLSENPEVQEPTRTWAGVEAVITLYLDGKSAAAQQQATQTADHARQVAAESRIDEGLIQVLAKQQSLPSISAKQVDPAGPSAAKVAAWIVAGLKDWEQGMMAEAAANFTAATAEKISADNAWLEIYQTLAKDYLTDHAQLADPVFEKFPADIRGCEAAVTKLNGILTTLKTRGRARFNVQAWQLDLTQHAKFLAAPKPEELAVKVPKLADWDRISILAKLAEFANACRFTEASTELKKLPSDPSGATRASLIAVTDSAAIFLMDLEADLKKGAVAGDFTMKSGDVVRNVALNSTASVVVTTASGLTRSATWSDFSPDALISLHRIVVKNPKSEKERLRRHECAISYDWLAGNRVRALNAADQLSQSSPAFKQHWEAIASGLPN